MFLTWFVAFNIKFDKFSSFTATVYCSFVSVFCIMMIFLKYCDLMFLLGLQIIAILGD